MVATKLWFSIDCKQSLEKMSLIKGWTADNSGKKEIRFAHVTQNFHPSKSMCPVEKSCKINTRIQVVSSTYPI